MPNEPTRAKFNHWMHNEIHEQPAALTATLNAYVGPDGFLESCQPLRDWLVRTQSELVIVASGSSRHAGQVAELFIEDRSGIAVDVEYASEYSYRAERVLKQASVLVISQSGETVDTLAALRKAHKMGHPSMAITNVAGSNMASEAGTSFPTWGGSERAVPATKSFTTQLLNLYLLSLIAAEVRNTLPAAECRVLLERVRTLPRLVQDQLQTWDEAAQRVAKIYAGAKSFLFLGRGIHYPIAREAALKLKESSYLHAEGYPSGELKHGPNALVSDETPLVMLATHDSTNEGSMERYAKVLQLMADMHQQGARIFAVANTGDDAVASLANDVIWVRETQEELLTICEIIPLQLFAYYVAIKNGIDVDNPRNLSKAVLVE